MIEIIYRHKNVTNKVFVKCEHYNLTGSIKDRMALYILQQAYRSGKIKSNDVIVEATSGNTGISFSAIGKALGHDVKIIMPDWLSKERINIIESLGAEVILMSKEKGAFIAGVGTGGTIMGVGNYLRSRNPGIKIHPLEPAESPTLTTGYKVGSHRIQGISDEFIPAIVKLDQLDHVIKASDGDSILMAQKLAKTLGLAVGISSGANLIGAIQLQLQAKKPIDVVTIFCDSNKKYLSTDLMKEEPVKEGYLTPDIELLDYDAFSRL
jgi:cysteine synthase A